MGKRSLIEAFNAYGHIYVTKNLHVYIRFYVKDDLIAEYLCSQFNLNARKSPGMYVYDVSLTSRAKLRRFAQTMLQHPLSSEQSRLFSLVLQYCQLSAKTERQRAARELKEALPSNQKPKDVPLAVPPLSTTGSESPAQQPPSP